MKYIAQLLGMHDSGKYIVVRAGNIDEACLVMQEAYPYFVYSLSPYKKYSGECVGKLVYKPYEPADNLEGSC